MTTEHPWDTDAQYVPKNLAEAVLYADRFYRDSGWSAYVHGFVAGQGFNWTLAVIDIPERYAVRDGVYDRRGLVRWAKDVEAKYDKKQAKKK
jgi:hypothetical protein